MSVRTNESGALYDLYEIGGPDGFYTRAKWSEVRRGKAPWNKGRRAQ